MREDEPLDVAVNFSRSSALARNFYACESSPTVRGVRSGGFVAICGLAAVGCVPERALELPETLDVRAKLVVASAPRMETVAVAYAPRQPLDLIAAEDVVYDVIALERTLEALMIEPGPLKLFSIAEEDTRPFPRAHAAWRLDTTEAGPRWAEIDLREIEQRYATLRIPNLDYDACFEAGRCVTEPRDGENRACTECDIDAPEIVVRAASDEPCPNGWTSIVSADERLPGVEIGGCVPSGTFERACPAGTIEFFNGCRAIEEECGTDRWSPLAADTTERVWFVTATVATNIPMGTRDQPFTSLASALARATSGDMIALDEGDHARAAMDVPSGVTIQGVCRARTRITGGGAEGAQLSLVQGTVRDLHIKGGQYGVFISGSVEFERVLLTDQTAASIHVDDFASLSARDTAMENCGPCLYAINATVAADDVSILDSRGVGAELRKSNAELGDVIIRGSGTHGILAFGSTLTVARARILETNSQIESHGMRVVSGKADVSAIDVNGGTVGIEVVSGTARIHDAAFRRLGNDATAEEGYGLTFSSNATVTAERILFEDIRDRAVVSKRAFFYARDVTIRGMQPGATAVSLNQTQSRIDGLVVQDVHTGMRLLPLVDVEPGYFRTRLSNALFVRCGELCLHVKGWHRLDLSQALVADFSDTGVLVSEAILSAHDLIIRDAPGTDAVGLINDEDSTFDIKRFIITNIKERGVILRRSTGTNTTIFRFDARHGIISGARHALEIQRDPIPPWEFFDHVQFVDNERNL